VLLPLQAWDFRSIRLHKFLITYLLTYLDKIPPITTAVTYVFIDRVAGEIIRLVASVCVSVRLSVGALLFEPFDL